MKSEEMVIGTENLENLKSKLTGSSKMFPLAMVIEEGHHSRLVIGTADDAEWFFDIKQKALEDGFAVTHNGIKREISWAMWKDDFMDMDMGIHKTNNTGKKLQGTLTETIWKDGVATSREIGKSFKGHKQAWADFVRPGKFE